MGVLSFLAVFVHVPYLVWLFAPQPNGLLADARTFAALGATLLLFLTARRRDRPPPIMTPAPLTALGLLGCATSLGALGWWWHAAWSLSLPLAIGGIITRRSKTSLHNSLVLLVLLAIAYPFQRHVTIHFDHTLQYITAVCAAPLVNLSGLEVSVLDAGDPVIVGERLRVTVTSLCAGSQTLLALITLGLISAAVFLKQGWAIWVFALLTPVFGFVGNVVRVAISTHAVKLLGGDTPAWYIAHDVIGYTTFLLTYAALFWLVLRLNRVTRHVDDPPSPNTLRRCAT